MSEKVDIFMPLFIADYLRDTIDLSLEEDCVYMRLLMALWSRDGWLPLDHDRLARIVRVDRGTWDRVWVAIARFFSVEEGSRITQKRLSRELTTARARKDAATERGRQMALARWSDAQQDASSNAGGNAKAKPEQCSLSSSVSPSGSSPSQSSLQKQKRADARGTLLDEALGWFCREWRAVYGEDYVPSGGDKSQLGRMLATLEKDGVPVAQLPELFRRYVHDTSRFLVEDRRHDLTWFCTRGGVNKYRTQAVTSGYSEKEIRGMRAAATFVEEGNARPRGQKSIR